MSDRYPRLVIAGAGGDAGKTLVSLALASAWRETGLSVSAFKKGPDYIDAAWLSRAAGRPARNLDVWLMGEAGVRASFTAAAAEADVSLIEGNRGVLDGLEGHTTASLARLLLAPLVLVVDATKVTRTAAAIVKGIEVMEPSLALEGVVLNRVGGDRHRRELTAAIRDEAGVPVVGAIPRLPGDDLLPGRHLGLVPPEEHRRMEGVLGRLAAVAREHLEVDALLALARSATVLPATEGTVSLRIAGGARVRVGVFRDSAFTFYYPENLAALEACGAELVFVSGLSDRELPDADLLYLGGGFPETHVEALSANTELLETVRAAAEAGLPIYAECGGLIYLARSVLFNGRKSPLAGVLPVDVEIRVRPQAHGYAEVEVDGTNAFFPSGSVFRGHEFHYAAILNGVPSEATAFAVRRGTGTRDGRDGLVAGNVLATWLHVHALGSPGWAPALVEAARAFARKRAARREGFQPQSTEGSLIR
ncbi:MAG: cobyrinate a,c-diamide synthase [Planctomycetes bacterium]|jgi:cobyrinic acid a,c-diamide synthase|nr:cobyrinate a,c-diamide synthase [Planctomycetota bacterium]